MTQCFRFYGQGTDGKNYEFFACGITPEYRPRNSNTSYLFLDDINIAGTNYFYITTTAQVTVVDNDNSTAGYTKFGSCIACNAVSYDCINGICVKKTVYNTPGFYTTISDCETACGTGCSGKCISNAEWSQIQGLSSQLKNKNCS
ncbi:hypothetical protein [Halotia branconii]|uniref:Uncharacterized protein n=1 Tax=Halotia branconii CENA392 TaxID=1539056 RepID=A0AAJ6P7A0_9CYAN|nr:hypothetical protein [Halotia branconii]WGV23367.1 hypothetical protein QI031_16195 [Halotia branconii CENA392]